MHSEVIKQIIKRDGNKCRCPTCFYSGSKIHFHRIYSRKENPSLAFEPANIIMLCSDRSSFFGMIKIKGCHNLYHESLASRGLAGSISSLARWMNLEVAKKAITLIIFVAVFSLVLYVA